MSPHPRISRRGFLIAGGASYLCPAGLGAAAIAPWTVVAKDLLAPESPKPQRDGSVLLVEMMRGSLSRVQPDGRVEIVANLGHMPNGCARGPDGAIYVANNAAARFKRVGSRFVWAGVQDPKGQSSIQRVDAGTGRFSTLYKAVGQEPLVAPNDLVFSRRGHFYFTDIGAQSPLAKPGAVFVANVSGTSIRRIANVPMANGVVLSPDERRLLVASERSVFELELDHAGEPLRDADGGTIHRSFAPGAQGTFDSMAAEADGGIVIGTLFPGGLTRYDRGGQYTSFLPIPDDQAVTNIGFGGPGLRTAYISLTGTGQLLSMSWDRPGLKLAFEV